MSTKKKTTNVTNQTQTAAPPTWTLPGLTFAGDQVTQALKNTVPGDPYTGDFVAGADPTRAAAQIAAYDAAANTVGGLGVFGEEQVRNLFQPRDSSMLLQEAIKASIDPVFKRLTEETLPGITNSALQSGAYTNDRALGVVPTQAIGNATEAAQRIGAELGYQGFQADENRRLQLGQMLPSLTNMVAQLATAKGDVLGAGTSIDQQLRQDQINNEVAKHQYGIQAPYERIAPAAQLLALLSGNWGTQTMDGRSETTQKTTGLGPILQGAMGLASMAAGLGAFGPLGAAAGAAGSAAAPAAAAVGNMSQLFPQIR